MKPAAPVTNVLRSDIKSPMAAPVCLRGPLYLPPGAVSNTRGPAIARTVTKPYQCGHISADRRDPRLLASSNRAIAFDAPDCAFLAENTCFRGAAVPDAAQ